MSKNHPIEDKLESHKVVPDLNDLEMVFGTPKSPKSAMKPNTHLIENEKIPGKELVGSRRGNDSDVELIHPSQPLLEPDKQPPKPPLAGPEIDDLDGGPGDATPYPGIDDGLFAPIDKLGTHHGEGGHVNHGEDTVSHHSHIPTRDDAVGTEDGKWPWHSTDEADYPYDGVNGFGNRFGLDDRPVSPFPGSTIPDVNTYQQKKNLAQGMMDLALLSANANQLRYVLESATTHPYYYPSLVFISMSIILQIAVGVGLILNSRYNVKDDKDICKADKINNMTVLGVFLVTIVNVFIASFSVASNNTVTTAVQTGV